MKLLLARKGPVTLLLHDWGLIARPTNLADDPIAVYVKSGAISRKTISPFQRPA
jgi:ABC-type spermidine/putrescine transport system permease subunit I